MPDGLTSPDVPDRIVESDEPDGPDEPDEPGEPDGPYITPPPTIKGSMWIFDVRPTIWPQEMRWSYRNQANGRIKITLGSVYKYHTISSTEALDHTIRFLMLGHGLDWTKQAEVDKNRAKRRRKVLKRKKKRSRYPPLSGRGCVLGLFVLY
jgi:hypothetical protein